MTRVLIVDDEILVRISLKTLIPWQANGFELVGEAENGRQALAMLETCPCDIVLTDIRMPEMDGIELMSAIRAKWPGTRIIVLSNHNDFEYVQRALRMGANDYILKLAWVPAELLEKCMDIRNDMEDELIKHDEERQLAFKIEQLEIETKEKQLRKLLLKQGTSVETDNVLREFQFNNKEQVYRFICVSIDNYQQIAEESRFKSEQLFGFTIANILNEILKKYGGGELIEVKNGRFAILVERLSEDMLIDMRSAAATFAQVSLSFGIVRDAMKLYDLHDAFVKAENALNARFYDKEAHFMYDFEKSGTDSRMECFQEDYWSELIDGGHSERLHTALLQWYEKQKQTDVSPKVIREKWLQLLFLFEKKLAYIGKDLYAVPSYNGQYPFDVIRNAETLQEIVAWFGGWAVLTIDYMRQSAKLRYRSEIVEVMNLIQKEYQTSLKVADIAKRVGFAESYLSVLFKKETGEKIIEYLTKVRMKKARELLKDPSYKIYEISEMIGYGDPTHFSKYFKKIEGVFPLEYRKSALNSLENHDNI
ncbi:AraC family transcriptional regulator [Paenibacillus marchantiophytorum]|uniref:AraC family transcriptional regulator n=1 Tax=Paenibacillus marchantiophytorum TaxID=1619310 RepID=A0ABQ2BPV6_9BACL|nr:response regulator [Paenibacillus marchantiophytorum]GGI44767.1 AraC family transcriptional regulator [Paenibacillus marchantiophytorum]